MPTLLLFQLQSAAAGNKCNKVILSNLDVARTKFLSKMVIQPEQDFLDKIPKGFEFTYDQLVAEVMPFTSFNEVKDQMVVTLPLAEFLNEEPRAWSELLGPFLESEQFLAADQPLNKWSVDVMMGTFSPGQVSQGNTTNFHLDIGKISSREQIDLGHSDIVDSHIFVLNLVERGQKNPAPTQVVKKVPDLAPLLDGLAWLRGKRDLSEGSVPEFLKDYADDTGPLALSSSNATMWFLDYYAGDFKSEFVMDLPTNQWVRFNEFAPHRRQPAVGSGQRIFVRLRTKLR